MRRAEPGSTGTPTEVEGGNRGGHVESARLLGLLRVHERGQGLAKMRVILEGALGRREWTLWYCTRLEMYSRGISRWLGGIILCKGRSLVLIGTEARLGHKVTQLEREGMDRKYSTM